MERLHNKEMRGNSQGNISAISQSYFVKRIVSQFLADKCISKTVIHIVPTNHQLPLQ